MDDNIAPDEYCTDHKLADIDEDLARKLAHMEANMNENSGPIQSALNSADNTVDLQEVGDDIIHLTELPTEILIHIASFLDSRVIIASLYRTCRLFYDLFSNDRYWKTRISQRWSKPYPIFEHEDFNWRRACMEREEVHKMWTDPQDYYDHFMVTEGFFAAVDNVHLMKGGRYLAIGSRDRHLNILDLSKYDPDGDNKNNIQHNPQTSLSIMGVPPGWVWSMASHGDTLVTGSWDTYIRLWDTGDGNVQLNTQYKLKTAILGVHYEPNFIAAGGFDKRLYLIDPRSPDDVVRKCYHRQPILSIAADDKYVITGSEDKTIAIYDRMAGKKFQQIEMESFVMSMSYGDGQLWTGDKEGKLNVLDTRDGLFDENTVQTFDIGHTGRLTGVVHTEGGIFTGCTDSLIKVIEPSVEPGVINTLSSHTGNVARISYKNGILASAGTDISVGVWIPKNRPF